MDNIWFASALWIGLALIAASLQAWVAVSVALLEIIIGAIAGNLVDLTLTPWVNYLAGFGAILLTFLAGAEIDAKVIRRHFGSTMAIGVVGFFAPYLGVLAWAHFISGWPWPQAQIAGIALSTTSVPVVYAVMIETGFNNTEIGKIILAACFINDIGTVLALGLVFANYNFWLLGFAVATVLTFRFERKEGMYTTLMMSTGLTFGSISALFGLTNHIINQEQYTILVTAVIGS